MGKNQYTPQSEALKDVTVHILQEFSTHQMPIGLTDLYPKVRDASITKAYPLRHRQTWRLRRALQLLRAEGKAKHIPGRGWVAVPPRSYGEQLKAAGLSDPSR